MEYNSTRSSRRDRMQVDEALQGKVVLVTGGAKRVGAAISRRLHAAGAGVLVHYRSAAIEARALQVELNAQRPDSVALAQADLLKVANCSQLVKAALKQFGRLDALVNNASSSFYRNRRDHRAGLGGSHRHQSQGAAVSRPGGDAGAEKKPRLHRQPDRHPCRVPDAEPRGLHGREGRASSADARACARPWARGAGERDRPGHHPVARRRRWRDEVEAPAHHQQRA